MLTRLKGMESMQSLVIAALLLNLVVPKCVAQVTRSCHHGNCGSPLAGPCVPARVTYGYVPTSWRRWPTDNIADTKIPEELPTPATLPEKDPLPAPEDAAAPGSRQPSAAPDEPRQTPADDAPTPPFGDATTPSFSDEPPAFGDEPQAPPSSADPLAVPFGDAPPTPPADIPSGPPQTGAPSPSEPSAPLPGGPGETPPAAPDEDLFKDDPFKDDPEAKTEAPSNSGAGVDVRDSANWAREVATHREQDFHSIEMQADAIDSIAPASEPRLLQADGRKLTPAHRPEPIVDGKNPLRQVSHPGRKTGFQDRLELPVVKPTENKPAIWRKNPLRGN